MQLQFFQNAVALLARQAARAAQRNPALNDVADTLFVTAVKLGVPANALPQ